MNIGRTMDRLWTYAPGPNHSIEYCLIEKLSVAKAPLLW